MDSELGLTNDGQLRYGSGIDMDYGDYNTSNSRLWVKLKQAFQPEITERYIYMRSNGYLTYENLLSYYEGKVIGTIGEVFYNKDQRLKYANEEYKGFIYMCNGSRLEHTKRWISERIKYMDSVFEYGSWMDSAVVRSNDILGEVTLRLKTYSPQHVSISFSDQASGLVKKYCDKDKWYDFTGYIQNNKDNNISIKGIGEVMYIDGLDQLSVSSMLVSKAKKLVEIDIHGSRNIQQLELGSNVMLQRLDCHNCINLGIDDNYKSINLEGCINLKHLDLSNTKVGEVLLNKDGGALEYFDLSQTLITNLECNGQEYLPEIRLNSCKNLSTISVSSCNALTRLELPNSKLSKFKVTDCVALDYLDISYTGYLTDLDLTGCESLSTLVMAGVSNNRITEVDLRTLINLESLDISKCDFINNVRFANGFNKLKTINFRESGIKTFQFGNNAIPNYLDLTPFNLSFVDFYNCTQVSYIRGINLYATQNMSPFYNCVNLTRIDGTVDLYGNITRAFYNCKLLKTLPTLKLNRVTEAGETFYRCESFTFAQIRTILNSMTICTDFYKTFSYCLGAVCTEYPSDLFSKNLKMSSLYWIFEGCENMTGQLPIGIFDNNTELVTVRKPFYKITGYVPPNLFAYNKKLQICEELFSDMKELTVGGDETMFAYCPELKHVHGLFNGCTNAVIMLNDKFFENNPKLQNCDSMFNDCKSLFGQLPPNLLRDKKSLSSIHQMFRGCTGLNGEVPDYFLGGCTALNDIYGLFQGCTGLTGKIKTNFWEDCQNITLASNVFNGCSGLGGNPANLQEIPSDFFKKKYRLNDINGFFQGCNRLGFNLLDYWFKDCRQLAKISNLFNGCTNATGYIPENLFTVLDENEEPMITVFSEAKGTFRSCLNLVGTIPENLFERFLSVRDLSEFFYDCRNLEGAIPPNLFKRCYSVVNMSSMFYQACKIGRYTEDITEDEPWALDPYLFSSCANLTNTSNMFNMWNYGTKLKGTLPPELFRSCPKLENISGMFQACSQLTGDLESGLFRNNPSLVNVSSTFYACSGLNGEISGLLFSDTYNPKINNFGSTFRGCSNLKGTAPALWSMFSNADRILCFNGCIGLDNYASIPDGWK